MKVALLNTSIITNDGDYSLRSISLKEAKEMVQIAELDSAIGHQSTADIMSTLLEVEVVVNRQMFSQQIEQKALVFKLNGRPEEGKILSKDEIEDIGYTWKVLARTK
ncbi:MAG: DUF1874 domain-containing protein [Rivularia sp. (in: cyanobacteria)]